MRFQLATLFATLFATATTASPIPDPSTLTYPLTATVNFETLNGVDCVLQMTGFGDFTGYTERIGAYHSDTNSCSIEDPTSPVYSISDDSAGYPIVFLPTPQGRAPAGTILIEIAWDNVCHGAINPNIVNSPQSVTVEKGYPDGFPN